MQWPSPGFATAPPNLRQAELIPPDIRAQMAPAWDTRHYQPSTVRLHAFDDVFVIGEGLLFDRNLDVVPLSLTQYAPDQVALARERLRAALASGTVPRDRDNKPTLLCQKRGMDNFGHWLIELLPMAHLALPWLQSGAWQALVPVGQGPMQAVITDSLALLGVPAAQCLHGDGSPRHLARALLMHGLTAHGWCVSPLVMRCMDAVASAIPPGAAQPVWVTRRGRHRALWNEAELAAILEGLGWRVLEPDGMPFGEQVAAFRGATAVAGVHGAGLTGAVFAPPGTRVTSFAPAAMPDTFFWLLTTLRHQDYVEVRSPHQRGFAGNAPWDASLVLTIPELLRHLAP